MVRAVASPEIIMRRRSLFDRSERCVFEIGWREDKCPSQGDALPRPQTVEGISLPALPLRSSPFDTKSGKDYDLGQTAVLEENVESISIY